MVDLVGGAGVGEVQEEVLHQAQLGWRAGLAEKTMFKCNFIVKGQQTEGLSVNLL